MPVSRHVVATLKRRGFAEVMVFVGRRRRIGRASKENSRRGSVIAVAHEDVEHGFLSDGRSIFQRVAGSTKRAADDARSPSGNRRHYHHFPDLGILLGTVDEQSLHWLLDSIPVARVTPLLQASLIRPIDRKQIARPTLPVTWGIAKLGVEALWQSGITGRGVKVAHLDTGVDADHPTLRGAVSAFAFFDEQGMLDEFQRNPFDTDEHGTHTAATIVGRPVNGQHVGVAPGATLLSAGVIEGGVVQARILAGMQWAIEQGARVLNISLGVRGYNDEFLLLTQRLRLANVLPVFAVGNEGANSSRSPGNYAEALSVGAIDPDDAVPRFSSSDTINASTTVPDLVAPGTAIESAMSGGGYLSMSGTSMSTPHISGLAALLLEANPEATTDQLEQAILSSCRPAGGALPEREGVGIPSALAALARIRV